MRILFRAILLILFITLLLSCVRKSGRQDDAMINKQPVSSEQTQKSRQNPTPKVEKQIIQRGNSSKSSMTGAEIFRKYNSAVVV